jgi:hypothetical protein
MSRIAFSLVAALASSGCSDEDGIAGDIGDDVDGVIDEGDIPPGVLQWNAALLDVDPSTEIAGDAIAQMVEGAQSFSATLAIRSDAPGAVRPWHVHQGTCETGGAIVGDDASYPRLTIGSDGTTAANVALRMPLDIREAYYVDVHFSDLEFNRIVACGDLILQ